MIEVLAHNINPIAMLYALQCFTYAAAAILSLRHGHRDLSACYAFSTLLHAGIGACHWLQLE